MAARERAHDRELLQQFREAWERYHNTGEVSHVEDLLAENIVHLPPDGPPVVGKDAVLDDLPDVSDRDWEVVSEDLVISDDLAVERFTVRWQTASPDGSRYQQGTVRSIDVYQRRADGRWKQVLSFPLRF